jgi:hypothetical protein
LLDRARLREAARGGVLGPAVLGIEPVHLACEFVGSPV